MKISQSVNGSNFDWPIPSQSDWKPFSSVEGHVRLILLVDWDPIGIFGHIGAMDEYDSYVPEICALLRSKSSAQQIEIHLKRIQTEMMCISGSRSNLLEVAKKLTDLFKYVEG